MIDELFDIIKIDEVLRSYKEQIQDRIAEFQPLLDDCLDDNRFEWLAKIKGIMDNLHEHLDVAVSAMESSGKKKRGLVKQLLDMERLDLTLGTKIE